MNDKIVTPRDMALASVPQDRREALLTRASDLGVHRSDDVIWALVAAVVDATAAADAAGRHVEVLKEETAKLPGLVYDGAKKAGTDISGQVRTAIESTVTTAGTEIAGRIDKAATAGAAALQKAASGLDTLAAQKQDAFVENWKGQVIKGINSHAHIALAWHLGKSWGTVVSTIVIAMILGAGVGLGSALYYHKLIISDTINFYPKGTFPSLPATVSYNTSRLKQISCGAGRTCLSPDP